MTQTIENWSFQEKQFNYFKAHPRVSWYLTIEGRAPFGKARLTIRGRVGDSLLAGDELFKLGNIDPAFESHLPKAKEELFAILPQINHSPL